MKCDSADQFPLPEMEQSLVTMGMASAQAREMAPSSTRAILQFGDGDTRPTSSSNQRSSTDILELLKEESDLLDDDDEPMSFMQPTLSLRKGMHSWAFAYVRACVTRTCAGHVSFSLNFALLAQEPAEKNHRRVQI